MILFIVYFSLSNITQLLRSYNLSFSYSKDECLQIISHVDMKGVTMVTTDPSQPCLLYVQGFDLFDYITCDTKWKNYNFTITWNLLWIMIYDACLTGAKFRKITFLEHSRLLITKGIGMFHWMEPLKREDEEKMKKTAPHLYTRAWQCSVGTPRWEDEEDSTSSSH